MPSSAAGVWSWGGSSRITALTTCAEVCPANARVPDSISYKTAPKLKMSDRASRALPSACSGDMYAAVPTTAPSIVRVRSSASPSSAPMSLAIPKSSSLALGGSDDPLLPVTRTFAGFRSR
jgi:hypothetical protein